VTVRLDNQGELSIRSSSGTAPDSTAATYANSAARILNIDMSMVRVEPADTVLVPDSGPSVFSRETTVVHSLVAACCQAIQKQRFRAPLPMEVSRKRAGGRGRRWHPETFRGVPFSPLSWASCVVEIELDAVSFEVAIRGVWIALYVGTLADKKKAAATVENELRSAFEMCGAKDLAPGTVGPFELSIRFVQGTGARPAAIEGIAANVFAPAFVSAVSQATGFYFDSLPLSRSLILQYGET
jgi:CO/xanthine dehydrogenase Mo-binding subunit